MDVQFASNLPIHLSVRSNPHPKVGFVSLMTAIKVTLGSLHTTMTGIVDTSQEIHTYINLPSRTFIHSDAILECLVTEVCKVGVGVYVPIYLQRYLWMGTFSPPKMISARAASTYTR
jgi:hypothetical protein